MYEKGRLAGSSFLHQDCAKRAGKGGGKRLNTVDGNVSGCGNEGLIVDK
jgi:hypothetical protein